MKSAAFGKARGVFHSMNPRHRRARPDLFARGQLRALGHAAQADHDKLWILYRAAIQRRAAIRAKHLRAALAALRGFDIGLGRALQGKLGDGRTHNGAARRARQGLAIAAMADGDVGRVDVGGEGDMAAVAGAVDVHIRCL